MDSFNADTDKVTHRVTATGKVLYLVGSQADTKQPDMVCQIRKMRRYWEGLRDSGPVPLRTQVTVQGIGDIVEHAFLVERIAPGMARFRLVGQHLLELMGMELRGMPLCSLINRDSRRAMCRLTETVFRAPQSVELRVNSPASFDQPELSGMLLLLPLKSDLDDVTRALGCLVTRGETGSAPRRFDITKTTFHAIIPGGEILYPDALDAPQRR